MELHSVCFVGIRCETKTDALFLFVLFFVPPISFPQTIVFLHGKSVSLLGEFAFSQAIPMSVAVGVNVNAIS